MSTQANGMNWPPEELSARELAVANYTFWDNQCADLAERRQLCFIQSQMAKEKGIERMHYLAICRRDDARKALGE